MTISVLSPTAPAGPGAEGRGTGPAEAGDGGFGLVMAQHLAAPAEEAVPAEEAATGEAGDGSETGDASAEAPQLFLVGAPAGLTVPHSRTGAGKEPAEQPVTEDTAAAETAPGKASAGTTPHAAAAAGEGDPPTGLPTGGAAAATTGAARSDSGAPRSTTGVPIPAGMESTPVSSASSTAGAEQPAPAAGVGATTSSAAAPATAASNGSAVTSQVFPTIPALVSRGEGTHSMTLRLHPADLGEVQVTVTVKNGVVDVTLAAGREAQEAFRSGSAELRSILELANGATGQLTVRDLPTGPAPAASSSASAFSLPSSSADTHGETSGSTGEEASQGRSNDRDARGAANPDDAPSDPARPTNVRSASGLDLTL